MKIIKPPRATWRVCAVPLAAYCLLLLALPAVAMLLVAIWTGEDRWAMTAAVLGTPLLIVAAVLGAGHSEHTSIDDRKLVDVPLPWRVTPEDTLDPKEKP